MINLKIILALLLIALIPPVDYNEEENIAEPPVIFYQEEDYKFKRDDTIIDVDDGTIIQEGKQRVQQLN